MAKSTVSTDPVSEQDKFMLRLPAGMRDRIKANAEANNRSMNAEIVAVVEEHPELLKALERCKEHAVRLRESERRLMATIGDITASRAKAEAVIADLASENAELRRTEALQSMATEAAAEAAAEVDKLNMRLAEAEGRSTAFLEVITGLAAAMVEASGNDPAIMKMLMESVQGLGPPRSDGSDDPN